MSDTPQTNCPFCGGEGETLTGWDEDGNEVKSTCTECDGSGILN